MHATCWVWLLRDSFQKSTLPSPHGARGLNSSWQSEQQVPLATDADHQPHLLSVHPTATGSSSLAHLHAVIPPSKSKELPSVPETRSQLISLTAQSLVVALIKLKMRLKKKTLLIVVNNVDNGTWPRPFLWVISTLLLLTSL